MRKTAHFSNPKEYDSSKALRKMTSDQLKDSIMPQKTTYVPKPNTFMLNQQKRRFKSVEMMDETTLKQKNSEAKRFIIMKKLEDSLRALKNDCMACQKQYNKKCHELQEVQATNKRLKKHYNRILMFVDKVEISLLTPKSPLRRGLSISKQSMSNLSFAQYQPQSPAKNEIVFGFSGLSSIQKIQPISPNIKINLTNKKDENLDIIPITFMNSRAEQLFTLKSENESIPSNQKSSESSDRDQQYRQTNSFLMQRS